MPDLRKLDKIQLKTVIDNIENGDYIIPDFQRDFDWGATDIIDLFRSIFSDYYIGNILLLTEDDKKKNSEAFSCDKIKWSNPPEHRNNTHRRYIVLDGQQRLSSLHYAFFSPDKGLQGRINATRFYIDCKAFYDDDMDNAFISAIQKWEKDKYSKKEEQIKDAILPITDLFDCCYNRGNSWFDDLYIQHPELKGIKEKDRLEDRLKNILENYNVAYIELDNDLDTSRICEIFEKLNSKGKKLDTFDLLNAILSKDKIKLRTELWEKTENEDDMKFLGGNGILVLQTMSIIKQTYCAPKYLYYLVPKAEKIEIVDKATRHKKKGVLVKNSDEFIELWDMAIEAIKKAFEHLKLYGGKYGVISPKWLAYSTILPPFASLLHYLESNRLITPKTEGKLRKWYFASLLGKRYDSSTNTTAAKDYREMQEWFNDDTKTPESLSSVDEIEKLLDLHIYKGAAPYIMVLNTVIINGALDFFTGYAPVLNELNDHHIIPYSRWKDLGVPQKEINTVFNRTLISDTTNKTIGNEYPFEYLNVSKLKCGSKFNEVMKSHFISDKALAIIDKPNITKDDFYAFIEERRNTIIGYLKSEIFQNI